MNCMVNNLVGLLTVKMFLLAEILSFISLWQNAHLFHTAVTLSGRKIPLSCPTRIAVAFTFAHAIPCALLYFGTAEKNLQALYGVNLFFPLPKIYPGSVSTATAYTVCGRGCVCTVCMNTGVFRGTRTKCKPSASIQQVESCQGSFWQPTGGSCQLQQEDTSHCSWWKSDFSDYSLCYRLAMCRMLQCVPTPSVLP